MKLSDYFQFVTVLYYMFQFSTPVKRKYSENSLNLKEERSPPLKKHKSTPEFKKVCKYGSECQRKNPEHIQKYHSMYSL